ncbi:MAG: tetratricopeptide repeat protein [Actinophytocola sp.]|uniref:tetratricopeptide repeat protein n=1 Tax=Actinophytocola sp. TaxID=1872138 RepID=UPI003D6B51BB
MVSRRTKGWLLFTGATVLGAVVGLLAGYLLGDQLAGAVTGVVTAVVGVLGARGRALVDRGTKLRDELPDKVLGGGPRPVRELDDPVLLGVHPAARDGAGQVPAYVTRDVDDRLAEALRGGGFVLLSGESTAGKTRMAYEAMRRVLPDHRLVAPASRESVRTAVDAVAELGRCVVWLDDVERYLGVHGLTVPLLHRMLDAGAVVLGTIRVAELDRFGARHEAGLDGDERDGWRTAREVLRSAVEIPLARRWSAAELDRAGRSTDRRVRSALRMTDAFGLAELLADGPELARDWHNAWRPGGHPHGAALVAAAVDCRRAGLGDPVPLTLLAELAPNYLETRGGTTLRAEPLDDAARWATTPARGASSLLLPAGEDRVLAFDYLIDLVSEPVPLPVWLALVEWCDPERALEVGLAARAVARFEASTAAFDKAAAAGVPGAHAELAEAIGSGGDPRRAVDLLTEVLADLSPDDPETLRLRGALARFTQEISAPEVARRMFADLLADCRARLGPDHPDTLAVRLQAAIQLGKARVRDEAVPRLAELVDDHIRVHGSDHHETLRARHVHAMWTGRHGKRSRALNLFNGLLADRVRLQGRDHPNVLSTRFQIAVWTRGSGKPTRAFELFTELLPDSIRVLGEHHPHTVSIRYRIGLVARDVGRPELAVEQLEIVRREWANRFGSESERVNAATALIERLRDTEESTKD